MPEVDTYNPQPADREDKPTTGRDQPRQDENGRRLSPPVDEATADYLELLRVLASESSDGDEDEVSVSRAMPLDVYLSGFATDEGE